MIEYNSWEREQYLDRAKERVRRLIEEHTGPHPVTVAWHEGYERPKLSLESTGADGTKIVHTQDIGGFENGVVTSVDNRVLGIYRNWMTFKSTDRVLHRVDVFPLDRTSYDAFVSHLRLS